MEIALTFLSVALSLFSLFLTWYFGTKNRRLNKKVAGLEAKLSKIKEYSTQTGYKNMIHDGFRIFSYVGAVILITVGMKIIVAMFIPNGHWLIWFNSALSGVYLGCGFLMLELCIALGRANNSTESISAIDDKIDRLKSKVQ